MQHSKKLLAAAVARAFAAAPAAVLAQGSTVQIGGNLHLIYGIHNPNNDSISSKHDNLHMSEPQMFIRGEENDTLVGNEESAAASKALAKSANAKATKAKVAASS